MFLLLYFGHYQSMVHDHVNNLLAGWIRLNGSIVLCTCALLCQTNHVVTCDSLSRQTREEERREGVAAT
jgi:hypothetical protein